MLVDRRSFLAKTVGAIAAAAVLLPGVVHADAGTGYQLVRAGRELDGTARYPVPAADGATIDVDNEVILVRNSGKCMAFALSCPHQRAMLKLKAGDTAFRCPKHKSEYRIDGEFIRGRATRNMDRRSIRKDGVDVVVDAASVIKSDDDPAAWAAAVISV
ncbi:MAG: Rieske 2Fe-2S domain-containing protein [Gemmatimonadaceae bacterium]|nr:Rieske 2Fe-2S domain-containing protein [Gemmatimonadaceae bacterium]